MKLKKNYAKFTMKKFRINIDYYRDMQLGSKYKKTIIINLNWNLKPSLKIFKIN